MNSIDDIQKRVCWAPVKNADQSIYRSVEPEIRLAVNLPMVFMQKTIPDLILEDIYCDLAMLPFEAENA